VGKEKERRIIITILPFGGKGGEGKGADLNFGKKKEGVHHDAQESFQSFPSGGWTKTC